MQPNTCFFPIPPAAFHSVLPGYNTFLDLVPVQEAVPVSPDTTTEAIPESSALPAKATETMFEQKCCPVTNVTVSEPPVLPREAIPASHVVPTELILASHVMHTEFSPASCTIPTEIIPELLVLPAMANETTLKQPAVTVSAMDDTEVIPDQPALTTKGSESAPVLQTLDAVFESASVPDPTLPSRFTPELFPISVSAPVPESLGSALECTIPAPQAADSTLPYSTIFKPPLFKPVNTPRYTTYVSPIPHSMQPNSCLFPITPAAFHSALSRTKFYLTLSRSAGRDPNAERVNQIFIDSTSSGGAQG